MMSRKFNPRRYSDKQTIPWATSLRATLGTTALENTSRRYSAINFAIWWPLYLKMSEKTHDMYLGIIKIRSLKEGGNIWWATYAWKLLTNKLLTSMTEKYYYCTRHSGASPTRKSASQLSKRMTDKEATVDPIRCLAVMKLARSVFAHKKKQFYSLFYLVQIGFFVTRFTEKYSDRLVATASLKVLDFQNLKVLGSVRLSLRLCEILVQFVSFMLFSGHLEICFT